MSDYLSGSYDDCLRANTVLLARAQDAEAELKRRRAREAVLVEALTKINARCNGIVSDAFVKPEELLEAVFKFRTVSAAALATLDVEEKM